jgi:hypothetical protein
MFSWVCGLTRWEQRETRNRIIAHDSSVGQGTNTCNPGDGVKVYWMVTIRYMDPDRRWLVSILVLKEGNGRDIDWWRKRTRHSGVGM